MAAAFVFTERLHADDTDRMLSYLPLAHVYERAVLETCAMKTAGRIYFAESLDTFIADLRRARPTLFVSVPRLWLKFQQAVFEKMPAAMLDKMLADPAMRDGVRKKVLDGLGLGEVRHAATGSAPIPEALLHWYRDLGLNLLEGYAMSENFCVSHSTRPEEVRVGYVGRPVEGVEQRITDAGEVLVKSPGTMLGYYKAKDLTDEVLGADGFLKTGDRGTVDEIGRLKITGRVKELFKTSKGKYVAPAPIENLLLQHDDIEQALVSGAGMPQPFAMVVLSDAGRARIAEPSVRDAMTRSLGNLLDATNAKLDPHERLDRLVVVPEPWTIENGMLTPTMKVRRGPIEESVSSQLETWYGAPSRVVW
jgi:long-subunit acyl-CoA synthetase (AMP-forming)